MSQNLTLFAYQNLGQYTIFYLSRKQWDSVQNLKSDLAPFLKSDLAPF
jgi:hypothetical protein